LLNGGGCYGNLTSITKSIFYICIAVPEIFHWVWTVWSSWEETTGSTSYATQTGWTEQEEAHQLGEVYGRITETASKCKCNKN
jgi:hypothetical protein